MELTYYTYPTCSTCRKAKKWLEMKGHTLKEVHLVNETPTAEELHDLIKRSGLPIKSFFNTRGKKYRELGLKEKYDTLTDEERLELLASDGMLIKRPIVASPTTVTVGFKEPEFEVIWG